MMSLKYVAILLVIGTIFAQTNTTATTTTTTTTTTTPTLNPQGNNTCGIVGQNEPKNITDCTNDKSIPNYTCCLLTFKNQGGATKNKCDATVTAGVVGDYKNVVKAIVEGTYNLTYVDYQCASSYLTVSFIILLLAALLF
jgi:hypothetical protein